MLSRCSTDLIMLSLTLYWEWLRSSEHFWDHKLFIASVFYKNILYFEGASSRWRVVNLKLPNVCVLCFCDIVKHNDKKFIDGRDVFKVRKDSRFSCAMVAPKNYCVTISLKAHKNPGSPREEQEGGQLASRGPQAQEAPNFRNSLKLSKSPLKSGQMYGNREVKIHRFPGP